MNTITFGRRIAPGLALCTGITVISYGLEAVEIRLFGYAYVSALVLAILIGIGLRTAWRPAETWSPGIAFSGRMLLEVAVVLLGASISLQNIAAAGGPLIAGIAGVVAIAVVASYLIGRACGLTWRMATLIACGNSICGNSAIAAVAPVINADSRDIAASIAFTAVLGVVVVLGLPILIPLLGLTMTQYGVVAGLTVYAVPQVLAATVPISAASAQIGTLVKLVRVLMLGPMVLLISLAMSFAPRKETASANPRRLPLSRFVPWFIIGFLVLAALRSLGILTDSVAVPLLLTANVLAVVAMAALGLEVDLGVVAQLSGRVTTAVCLSLVLLLAISLSLVALLGVG